MEIDIYADIVPGKSLGGFDISESVVKYWSLLDFYSSLGKLGCSQTSISTVRYSFSGAPVELSVDIRTGKIYKISALVGYVGSFLKKIKVGDSINKVLDQDLGFRYEDFDMAFFSSVYPGIVLEPDIYDPLPEDMPKLNIEAITIIDIDYFKM